MIMNREHARRFHRLVPLCLCCAACLHGYAAKNMGFVSSPPAYLSLAPSSSSSGPLVLAALTSGVNYASASAGVLDSTVSVSSSDRSIKVTEYILNY
jgi:hypothetical protein